MRTVTPVHLWNESSGTADLSRRWRRMTASARSMPLIGPALRLLITTRDVMKLAREHWYDFIRVLRHSSAVRRGDTRAKSAALITMAYHGIEKGLALPQPRPGFGSEQASLLVSRLERYRAAYGFDETTSIALNVLKEYCRFQDTHGTLSAILRDRISSLTRHALQNHVERINAGGTKCVMKEDFLKTARIDLTAFFNSRSSVRQYTTEPVLCESITAAVTLARQSPSCCNRQASRVWVLSDRSRIQKALDIQGGARGFAQEVPMLLVITADLACFQSAGERNQALIDGGMFTMSLVYALHSLGLVTCCLNWSKIHNTDQRFRREFPIPPQESIVVLIAVGHPKDQYAVAQSPRLRVDELIKEF